MFSPLRELPKAGRKRWLVGGLKHVGAVEELGEGGREFVGYRSLAAGTVLLVRCWFMVLIFERFQL